MKSTSAVIGFWITVFIPTISLVCSRSRTFFDKGSSSTCFPSLCNSSWCFLDFSFSVRLTCPTTMSTATRLSRRAGIMISTYRFKPSRLQSRIRVLTCDLSLGLNKFLKVWLYKRHPLFDASLDVATTFSYIAGDLLDLSISLKASDKNLSDQNILLRPRQTSASASANILRSNRSSTR